LGRCTRVVGDLGRQRAAAATTTTTASTNELATDANVTAEASVEAGSTVTSPVEGGPVSGEDVADEQVEKIAPAAEASLPPASPAAGDVMVATSSTGTPITPEIDTRRLSVSVMPARALAASPPNAADVGTTEVERTADVVQSPPAPTTADADAGAVRSTNTSTAARPKSVAATPVTPLSHRRRSARLSAKKATPGGFHLPPTPAQVEAAAAEANGSGGFVALEQVSASEYKSAPMYLRALANVEAVNGSIDCINEHLLTRWAETGFVVPQDQVVGTLTAHIGDTTPTALLLLEKLGRVTFDRVRKVYDLQSR